MTMEKFHIRNRKTILLAALGGIYLPSLSRIYRSKFFLWLLRMIYSPVLISSLLVCTFAVTYDTFIAADTLIRRIMAGNNMFNDMLCSFRAISLNLNRNRVQKLFDYWDEHFGAGTLADERPKRLSELTKSRRRFVISSGCIIQFMLVSWSLQQFFLESKQFSVPVGLPVPAKSPDFEIAAGFILFCFTLFGPMLISVDSLIMQPLSWASSELKFLEHRLGEIVDAIIDGKTVDEQLKQWIIDHQCVLNFIQETNSVYHTALGIQLFCTTMTQCMISFIVATNLLSPFDAFIGTLFFIPNYILFYITSTYGDLITEMSANIFNEAFSKIWAVNPSKYRTTFKMIVQRTNSPVKIRIYKIWILNSPTYFSILQTAYSFFSFLRFLTTKEG